LLSERIDLICKVHTHFTEGTRFFGYVIWDIDEGMDKDFLSLKNVTVNTPNNTKHATAEVSSIVKVLNVYAAYCVYMPS